jgi:catechol 2,3-dioxygenase-like lactoylglutathione lyase family enzyme
LVYHIEVCQFNKKGNHIMSTKTNQTESAVEFATTTRVHVAINVSNVEQSLPFYRSLFGQEPTKVRPGYAKFEVAEPPVNFTLNQGNITPGLGSLSHLGIQVKSTAEVLAAKERFQVSGLATFKEEDVTCCYAVQDKVWVQDPDGNRWEVFVVLQADTPEHSVKQTAAPTNCECTPGCCLPDGTCVPDANCDPAACGCEVSNSNKQSLQLVGACC